MRNPEGPIYESIDRVDRWCIDTIQHKAHDGFVDAIRLTGNTICGRHPIGIIMAAINEVIDTKRREEGGEPPKEDSMLEEGGEFQWSFLRLAKSAEVRTLSDYSVTYVSMCFRLPVTGPGTVTGTPLTAQPLEP